MPYIKSLDQWKGFYLEHSLEYSKGSIYELFEDIKDIVLV